MTKLPKLFTVAVVQFKAYLRCVQGAHAYKHGTGIGNTRKPMSGFFLWSCVKSLEDIQIGRIL